MTIKATQRPIDQKADASISIYKNSDRISGASGDAITAASDLKEVKEFMKKYQPSIDIHVSPNRGGCWCGKQPSDVSKQKSGEVTFDTNGLSSLWFKIGVSLDF